jgi:hypothetical protein
MSSPSRRCAAGEAAGAPATRRARTAIAALIVVHGLGGLATLHAQVSYRGFFEVGAIGYPQSAPNDPTRGVAGVLARFEPSITLRRGVSLAASFDARTDTHEEVARNWDVTYWDRTIPRPAFAIRRLALTLTRGVVTLEMGKQFVRWGQVDIISPTDRFTPRDYQLPVSTEALGTTAARLTFAGDGNTLELVAAPRLVPSRMPMLAHRWIGLQAQGIALTDGGAVYPGGPQYGVRYSRLGSKAEFSVSFFQGYNHLPLLVVAPSGPAAATVTRHYPAVRSYGADAVVPLSAFALKAESAWIESRDDDTDDYGLYVLQAERQQGEWLLIGGYVGEFVTTDRAAMTFAPDRGLARSLVGRASYTIDANRSLAIESVARTNGDGWYAKADYTHGIGGHWRVTLRVAAIRGALEDYLGQYRRNSFAATETRFSY